MVKIESCLLQQMLSNASLLDKSFTTPSTHIYSPRKSDLAQNVQTLKAVYTHFSQSNRRTGRKSNTLERGEKLQLAIEDAKDTYAAMSEIQAELKQAYKELMAVYRGR